MGEKYLGNIPEVAALNGVRNLIVESTTNGIKKIPTSILKRDIYKDLPIDPVLSDTSENAVKNKVVKNALDTKANSIIKTSSGQVIHETDCAAVPPINIKLFGKGKQKVIPGNQLANITDREPFERQGLIWSTSGGSVTAKGTVTTHSYFVFADLKGLVGDFYVSGKGTYASVSVNVKKSGTDIWINDMGSFTLDGTENEVSLYCQVLNTHVGVTINETIYPMVNKGTTALPWEPFVGNEPSPNMNYPQKAEFLGESGSIVEKVLTGNLLELTEDMMWKCELLDSQTGSVRLNYDNNYSTLVAKSFLHETLLNNQGTPFSFMCDNLPSNYQMGIVVYGERENGSTYQEVRSTIGKFATIITTDFYSINKIELRIGSFVSGTSDTTTIINGLRFCVGDEEISFAPYTEQPFTSLTPNGLKGIPLGTTIPDAIKNSPIHMSGVYWDNVEQQYCIGDTKNEDGKDVQRIGKERLLADQLRILDSLCNEESNLFWLLIGAYYFSSREGEFLCDIATYNPRTVDGTDTNNGGCLNVASNNMFYIRLRKDSGITTLEEFKEYLTNNEVFIYTILDEPIVTETDVQYDVVMNYPNTTIVNDAGAYMECSYIADTKCYIDNLEKKHEEDIQTLRNAILSLGGNV